jgi:hypothetical protein
MRRSISLLLLILAVCLSGFAQREKPATETELAEIAARGKALYDYDIAAWHSTDAVMALSPEDGSFNSYVAVKSGSVWVVSYGKFDPNKTKFLTVYEATQQKDATEFKVQKFDKPKEDSGNLFFSARALETAKADFGRKTRPYNAAVLPAKDGQFYVYLLPAQTVAGIFPLGGDVRYLISKDGGKIAGKRELHKAIIEFKIPDDAQTPVSGYHTAILDDVPEDSDVFHVLTREPSIPEMIVSQKYVYQIAADGSIKYLMTTEAFKKIGQKP